MGKVSYSESFELFWQAYPRKTAKLAAWKAWQKHADGDAFLPQQIVADVQKRYRQNWFAKDKTKIPHPATWLNQRRWEDEDWEGEIKGNWDKKRKPIQPLAPAAPEIRMTRWQSLANRIMFAYIRAANGLPESLIPIAISVKNKAVEKNSGWLDEEIEIGGDQRECVMIFAKTMLDSLDSELSLSLRHRILP